MNVKESSIMTFFYLAEITLFNSSINCLPKGQEVRTLVNTTWVRSGFGRWEHCPQHPPPLISACCLLKGWSGECFPHLRAQLVGLHFGLFLESVVGVVVSECILDEGREHEHVANPEVNIQGLDG